MEPRVEEFADGKNPLAADPQPPSQRLSDIERHEPDNLLNNRALAPDYIDEIASIRSDGPMQKVFPDVPALGV
jgi:hypothetical protein